MNSCSGFTDYGHKSQLPLFCLQGSLCPKPSENEGLSESMLYDWSKSGVAALLTVLWSIGVYSEPSHQHLFQLLSFSFKYVCMSLLKHPAPSSSHFLGCCQQLAVYTVLLIQVMLIINSLLSWIKFKISFTFSCI